MTNTAQTLVIPIQVQSMIHTFAIFYDTDHQYSVRKAKRPRTNTRSWCHIGFSFPIFHSNILLNRPNLRHLLYPELQKLQFLNIYVDKHVFFNDFYLKLF